MDKDDIDDDHDLRTKEKYLKRMRLENKKNTCPCADCPSRDDCPRHGRCNEYTAWAKRYLKNIH